MRHTLVPMTFAALSALALAFSATPTNAAGDHVVVSPGDIQWSAAPPSLPKGAQAAVLYGDPSKEGLFVLRLRLPKGYAIPPHTHPRPEIVTIVSGTFLIGMGEKPDASKATKLQSGGFFAFNPGMTHFAMTEEDTVVQINSSGPWGINYVNAGDDPRNKTQ